MFTAGRTPHSASRAKTRRKLDSNSRDQLQISRKQNTESTATRLSHILAGLPSTQPQAEHGIDQTAPGSEVVEQRIGRVRLGQRRVHVGQVDAGISHPGETVKRLAVGTVPGRRGHARRKRLTERREQVRRPESGCQNKHDLVARYGPSAGQGMAHDDAPRDPKIDSCSSKRSTQGRGEHGLQSHRSRGQGPRRLIQEQPGVETLEIPSFSHMNK